MTVTECNIYGIPACRGLAVLPHDKDVSDKMHQMVKALSSQAVTGGSCNDIRLDTAATCVKHETGSCPGCEAQHSIRCSLLCGNAVTVQDCEVLTERQLAGRPQGVDTVPLVQLHCSQSCVKAQHPQGIRLLVWGHQAQHVGLCLHVDALPTRAKGLSQPRSGNQLGHRLQAEPCYSGTATKLRQVACQALLGRQPAVCHWRVTTCRAVNPRWMFAGCIFRSITRPHLRNQGPSRTSTF